MFSIFLFITLIIILGHLTSFHCFCFQIVPKRDKEKLEKLTELVGEENNRFVNLTFPVE